MYRDFIYLDINRVQSIIAQLEQGLLTEVLEGKHEQTAGRMQMAINLLAMMLPASVSGSVEHSRGASLSESRVLHDYAFEAARNILEDKELLAEADDLYRDAVPEDGFVLIRGAAQVIDFETYRSIAENVDKIDKFLGTGKKPEQKKQSKEMKDSKVMIDTFYRDAIRVHVTSPQGCRFIGPLIREHLRDDIQALIYKHGSRPKGEWNMLAEVTRIPLPGEATEAAMMKQLMEIGDSAFDQSSPSDQIDQLVAMFNVFQESIGSVSYPDIAVSPVAVYREVNP